MGNTYYEKIVKKVRKTALAPIILGGLMSLFLIMLICIYIFEKDWGAAIGFTVILLIPLALTALGIIMIVKPGGKNDRLAEMAEDIDRGIIYQDDFIIVSQRVIGSVSAPQLMVFRDDVIACWLYSETTNGIPTAMRIEVYTANPNVSLHINVYGRKPQIIDGIMQKIQEFCPNARMGYTPENFKYVKEIQNEYKRTRG